MDVSMMGNMNPYMGQMAGTGARPDPSRMFGRVDKNGDGGLDQSEFQTVADKLGTMTGETMDVEEIFSTFDTDQDGALSQEETKSVMEAHKPSGPPSGGMMPHGMMGEMGSFNSDMLGIEQYEQIAGMGKSEDPVSTLLEVLYEDDEDDGSLTESLSSISTHA